MSPTQSKFWHILMYVAFVILIFVTITIYVVALPHYFQNQVAFATEYYAAQLIHLNPHTYGIFVTTRDAMVTLTFWLVAGTLLWGNWKNPYRAFISTALIMAGTTFPNTLLANFADERLVFFARSIRYLSLTTFV